jgi:hypothetical protein
MSFRGRQFLVPKLFEHRFVLYAYLLVCVGIDAALLAGLAQVSLFGDAHSWHEIDLANLYGLAEESLTGGGAFRYAPIIGQALAPLASVPWPLFVLTFLGLQLAVVVAMTGRRWWLALVFPAVILELAAGNIELLMAAAIVVGFRHPAAWSFLLLTKITPGVGILWFAFRREWRSFGVALGVTAAIVALGVALAPSLWAEWVDALRVMSGLPSPTDWPPLAIRLPVAVALVWAGARTDTRWLVPLAAFLALPTIWSVSYALLAGSIALGAPVAFMLVAAVCMVLPGPAAFVLLILAAVLDTAATRAVHTPLSASRDLRG